MPRGCSRRRIATSGLRIEGRRHLPTGALPRAPLGEPAPQTPCLAVQLRVFDLACKDVQSLAVERSSHTPGQEHQRYGRERQADELRDGEAGKDPVGGRVASEDFEHEPRGEPEQIKVPGRTRAPGSIPRRDSRSSQRAAAAITIVS